MLDALNRSRVQQRQLVADAGHELRTPLTSLRTNIEVLARQDAMPARDRECLLADAVAQLEELTVLVGDLVELAREDHAHGEDELADVRLDDVVERAVDRARLHAPELHDPRPREHAAVTHGNRALLERAVANILDNACKWSPPGGTIDVALADGELTVRDHGPGIDPEDLPHVFDRFYRAPTARSMPGSGLGLAIVRNAALAHGGTVTAAAAPGGGTVLRLSLPVQPTPVDETCSTTRWSTMRWSTMRWRSSRRYPPRRDDLAPRGCARPDPARSHLRAASRRRTPGSASSTAGSGTRRSSIRGSSSCAGSASPPCSAATAERAIRFGDAADAGVTERDVAELPRLADLASASPTPSGRASPSPSSTSWIRTSSPTRTSTRCTCTSTRPRSSTLTLAVAMFDALTRFRLALGVDPIGPEPTSVPVPGLVPASLP